MVKITSTKNVSDYEKQKSKKEPDSLLIGKDDKSISVLSLGELLPIKELATFNRTGTLNGVLKIPTGDMPFIVQYGIHPLPANSTATINFHEAFPTRVFQVIPSLKSGEGAISFRVPIFTNETFDVSVSGGSSTNNVINWIAIGF